MEEAIRSVLIIQAWVECFEPECYNQSAFWRPPRNRDRMIYVGCGGSGLSCQEAKMNTEALAFPRSQHGGKALYGRLG